MWCCQCELKTEVLVIGIIYMVGSSISALTHLTMASSPRIVISDADSEGEEPSDYAPANALAYSIVASVINGLLLYGIIKESRFYIIPWLVFYGVSFFVGGLLLLFLPGLLLVLFALVFAGFLGYPWYTIWKYFRTLDPHNPERPPQTALYATTGFTNGQFVPDNNKPVPPNTVVYTPGLPAYNDIVAQPQNV